MNVKRCGSFREQCSTPRARYGVGWGGIITNVVVVFKMNVKRCGSFREQCSTGAIWGGLGRDNYKSCSCIQEECEALWAQRWRGEWFVVVLCISLLAAKHFHKCP